MSTTITHIEKKTRAPKLRFKGFDGSWANKALSSLSTKISDGLHSTPNYEENGEYYFVNGNNLINGEIYFAENTKRVSKEEYIKHKKDLSSRTILISINGTIGSLALYNDEKIILGKSACYINVNIGTDKYFIYNSLQTWKIRNFFTSELTGSTIRNLSLTTIKNCEFGIPTHPEQQKIASFLSAVDEKIQQLTRKKELLEQYKKGVMQQLFSGKLRFKPALSGVEGDEKGKAFPEWEEKTLFDISENVSYGMNAAAMEFDGVHKYIRITDIDINSGKFIPNPLTSPDGEIEEKFRLKENDIVFARTGASVGKSYLYNSKDGQLYYAGFLIKFSIVNANPYFVYSLTLREAYYKWVHVYSMRSGQPGLNAEEYKALKFKLPSLPEQQKIATYLSNIDTKIESVKTQITQTQTFKKGLLQQMFV